MPGAHQRNHQDPSQKFSSLTSFPRRAPAGSGRSRFPAAPIAGQLLKVETPLAFQSRKQSVTLVQCVEQLRSPRVNQRPFRAQVENTVPVGKSVRQTGFQAPSKHNRTLRRSVFEEMVQNSARETGVRVDLYNFTDSLGLQMVKIPSGNLLSLCLEE